LRRVIVSTGQLRKYEYSLSGCLRIDLCKELDGMNSSKKTFRGVA
jgi:hypothetical protein